MKQELDDQRMKVIHKIWELEKELRIYISMYVKHSTGMPIIRELVLLHDEILYKSGKKFIDNDYHKDII